MCRECGPEKTLLPLTECGCRGSHHHEGPSPGATLASLHPPAPRPWQPRVCFPFPQVRYCKNVTHTEARSTQALGPGPSTHPHPLDIPAGCSVYHMLAPFLFLLGVLWGVGTRVLTHASGSSPVFCHPEQSWWEHSRTGFMVTFCGRVFLGWMPRGAIAACVVSEDACSQSGCRAAGTHPRRRVCG